MGIPTSIATLLTGTVVEGARIEFKETWDAGASLKTICAFANDLDNWGGGYLVIGVRESEGGREPIGVPPESVDRILKDMLNKCKQIRPDYMPIVDVTGHEGKTFIVAWCPGGSMRPYSSPKSMARGETGRIHYIRKLASTVVPTEEEERDLYNLANNVPFDDRVNHAADVSDLDPRLIADYLKEIGSDLYPRVATMDLVELGRSMNIVDGPPEYVKPKNVGLLFFNPAPERYFPCAEIDIVEFPEGLGGDVIRERVITGPLQVQLRDALHYLRNNVMEERVVKDPDTAEAARAFNYPYAALEESLSNAVYHKGYDVREPIEVRVLPDRIEILSYPGPDRSISAEALRTYRAISRRYRNRRIGEFLKELHLTEGRNTGISKILRSMRLNGSPEPVFETDADRMYFLTTLPVHPGFSEGGLSRGGSGDDCKPTGREEELAILEFFARDPRASISLASEHLGIPKATLTRRIAVLKEEGKLTRQGSARSGRWVVSSF